MTTLKDISAKLGLSVTQVSRALNGHSDVNEATRQRVLEVAQSLNYQPNVLARKLVSGRSGIVGLVVSNNPLLVQDNLFLEVVAGLSAQFSGRGMQFVLHIAPAEDDILSVYTKLVNSGTFDGFVLSDAKVDDPRIDFLTQAGVPFVLHGRTGENPQYPFFDIDNWQLAWDQTQHLIKQGHRRIASILGPQSRAYSSARAAGYSAALQTVTVQPQEDYLRYGPMNEAHGLVSTIGLMTATEFPPTAILCANVLVAKGVYEALKSLNLRIPDDISVIAHDDLLPHLRASAFFPALTVTKAPLRDSWLPLADFLVGALDAKPLHTLQRVVEHTFIARNSVSSIANQQ